MRGLDPKYGHFGVLVHKSQNLKVSLQSFLDIV